MTVKEVSVTLGLSLEKVQAIFESNKDSIINLSDGTQLMHVDKLNELISSGKILFQAAG